MVRNFIIFTIICSISMFVNAQIKTEFLISDFSGDNALKEKIQSNITSFINEINIGYEKKKEPKFEGSFYTADALNVIKSLWESSPIMCTETQVISKLIKQTDNKWQVREIPIMVKRGDENNNFEEGVIVLNENGDIDNFYFGIESGNFKTLMNKGMDVTEFRRRQLILDFVENFRTSYNRKDIQFLDNVFSENALIIVGKVVKSTPMNKDFAKNSLGEKKVELVRLSKAEYMGNLKKCFANNSYIKVSFDSIEIKQSLKNSTLYGVALKQQWKSSNYGDVGYVFLLISFKDESKPLIYVRTWEPSLVTKRKEAINLNDFAID